jgi:hypothetical protein
MAVGWSEGNGGDVLFMTGVDAIVVSRHPFLIPTGAKYLLVAGSDYYVGWSA